jgi:cell division transport system permease protein
MSTKPAATANLKRVGRLGEHRRESARAFLRLRAAPVTTLVTLLVIGIALLLPSLLNHLQRALTSGVLALQSEPSISVYLKLEASKDESLRVSEQILQLTDVDAIEIITPAQALAQLGETAGLDRDFLASFDDEVNVRSQNQSLDATAKPRNPLPTTLVVTPSASINSEQTVADTAERLAAKIRAIDSVDSVTAEGAWLMRLHALAQIIRRSAQLLAALMAIGLLAAIGNTVRLSVEQRRDEIRVSKLIGASNGYIARPFLYAGLFLGLGGGLVAWLLQLAVVGLVGHEVNQFLALYTAQANSAAASTIALSVQRAAQDLGLLLGTGAALGWLAALVASHRAIVACEP